MSSQKKFLLVVNPIAGGNDKTPIVKAAKEFAAGKGVELIEYLTTGEDDKAAIRKLFKEHKPERILTIGGDGTVKLVAEAVEKKEVIIGVLPAGSANGLSVDLNLSSKTEDNLKTAFGDNFMEMDMVSINGKKSLHLSDIGVNAELIRKYEEGTIRGKLGYALKAISTLTELRDPFTVTITAEGRKLETEARMVVIANTRRYGTGVTINPIGKMDDGRFEIIVLKNLELLVIGKILSGNIPVESNEDVQILSTDKAVITTDVPVCFQIDGEFCGEEQKLEVKILHKRMKVAIPAAT